MADRITQGVHGCSREDQYVYPESPILRERLEWFQDQKLALMMHFGPYSQMGIRESWPLSDQDAVWSCDDVTWETDRQTFRSQYVHLNQSFNPVCIDPDQWADVAWRNGFRYLIFTTKHHDGFCMFDTKQTRYKVTDESCPFHTHKYADITRSVFDAFRRKGMGIAAYFSKPDWHCPWYWAEGMEKAPGSDRNPTYDPAEHPAVWEKFVQFTQKQMMELIEHYGRIDILWLDGGQVRPDNGQDIRLSEFAARARVLQPWLLLADRTVGGENENYITPEHSVPEKLIHVPWESCIKLGKGWGFRYDDQFMSVRSLVHLLIDVVSRGGNLAVDIGPQPNGMLPAGAVRVLDGLGLWLKENGEAIYGTRPAEPNQAETVAFTRKGHAVDALIKQPDSLPLGEKIFIPWPEKVEKMTLLGAQCDLAFSETDSGFEAVLPAAWAGSLPIAPVIRME